MTEGPRLDIPRLLGVLPMFNDIGPAEIQRLAQGCVLTRYERGAMVLRQGDPCEAFYVVVTGQVKLFGISPAGAEKVIELIGPGGSFAEAMVFMDRSCVVNAQTLADSLLLAVRRHAVLAEVQQDPRFAMHMLAGLSKRLHGLVRDVQAYALQNGVQRVIGYLLRDQADAAEAGAGPLTVTLAVSKATVASRLSLTPEYFSRVLRELEDVGLIEVDRRDVRIRDVRRLAAYQGS
ncbi:MAG: Crp/Fnr family transcriptional regulator [Aquabacterium sp.]